MMLFKTYAPRIRESVVTPALYEFVAAFNSKLTRPRPLLTFPSPPSGCDPPFMLKCTWQIDHLRERTYLFFALTSPPLRAPVGNVFSYFQDTFCPSIRDNQRLFQSVLIHTCPFLISVAIFRTVLSNKAYNFCSIFYASIHAKKIQG
jgi:hypothetical protein